MLATGVLLAEALSQVPVALSAGTTGSTGGTDVTNAVGSGNSGRAIETTPTRIRTQLSRMVAAIPDGSPIHPLPGHPTVS